MVKEIEPGLATFNTNALTPVLFSWPLWFHLPGEKAHLCHRILSFCFFVIQGDVQSLFLVLCSEIRDLCSEGFRGPYVVLGIKPGLVVHKARTLALCNLLHIFKGTLINSYFQEMERSHDLRGSEKGRTK